MDPAKTFFSGKGRIRRKDFWVASLALLLLALPLRLLGDIGDVVGLAFLYPHVCLFAKRLHDVGRSGWLAAALYVPPGVIGLAIGIFSEDHGDPPLAIAALLGVLMIGWLVFYFRIGLKRGEPGANAYGPPTVAQAETAPAI